jgi:hypothetical protein
MTMTRHSQASCRACWLAGVLALAVAGCGSGTGDVSGTVRFKGVPMWGGKVTFTSQDQGGVSVSAWIGEDGSYSIRGCPTGPARITVLPLEPSRGGRGFDNPRGVVAASGSRERRKLPVIPRRYTDANTTDLEYTVGGGRQQHDIELKP